MVQKIIGVKKVDYQRTSDKKRVTGCELQIASEMAPSEGVGFIVSNVFLFERDYSEFPLGEILTLTYSPGFNGQPRCTGVIYKEETPKK